MTQPTLQQVFGDNATQDASTITIAKADLPSFTPEATNTSESILVAIILKASAILTQANRDANPDQDVVIDAPTEQIVTTFVNNVQQRINQKTISVNLFKPQSDVTINPMDF